MTDAIDLTTEQRTMLSALLRRFLPGVAVWAYGSRVKWTARPNSDLDLVAFTAPAQRPQVSDLKDALAESNLPFPVDLHVWDDVPERFREIIRQEYVVVQEAKEAESGSGSLGIAGESSVVHIPSTALPLPSDWQWERLDEVCDGVFDCPHSTPVLTADGPFVVRSQDMRTGVFRMEEAGHVSEETYQERIVRAEPKYGDLFYSREGTYFGIAAEVPAGIRVCLGQRMVLLRPKVSKCNHRFLRYWLNSPVMASHTHGHRDGTVAERLNLPTIRQLPVVVPPLPEQRAIAHILGALDDKIELNRRMNETLEAMARALFKSWFVDFDPVRAKVEGRPSTASRQATQGLPKHIADLFPDSFEDSEMGEIPRGWEAGIVDDLADISSGKRPEVRHAEASAEAKVPLWGGNGPMAFVPNALIEHPILLTGRVGTLGVVFQITTPCWPSDNTLVIRAKNEAAFEYLFFQLHQIDFHSLNRGSTQPLLTQTDLKVQPLVLPPLEVLAHFHRTARSLFKRADETHVESRTISALRDTLLAKLITGKLRVKDANRIIAQVT